MESAVVGVQPLPDNLAAIPMDFVTEAARLAAASYADVGLNHAKVGLGSEWRALTARELDPNSSRLSLTYMPGTTYSRDGGAAQVYVSADGTRLAVSFRGTDSTRDYLSYPTLLVGNYVDRFHDLMMAVQAYLRASNITSDNVVLTGHSLGGAAAELAHVYIPRAEVITFASPQTTAGIQIGFDNDYVFRLLPLSGDDASNLLLVHAANSRFDGSENVSVAHSIFNYIDAMDLLAATSISLGFLSAGTLLQEGPIAIMAPNLANLNALQLNAATNRQLKIVGNSLGNFVIGRAQGDDIDGGGGNDTLVAGDGDDRLWGNADHDDLRGYDGDDTLWGGDGNDSLFGNAGRDQLTGGSGHDLLRGHAGDDRLWGEGGNDTLYGDTNDLPDFIGRGSETLIGGTGNDLIVSGEGDDGAWGDADNDTIFGEAGNDTLRGGAGTDRLIGGLGDDNYWLNDVAGVVVEALNQGRDIVYTTGARAVLAAHVEELHAALDDQGNGGYLARHLTGNVIDNWIAGLGGADTLIGGAGNDTFRGGGGVDWLYGGAGDDVYLDEGFYGVIGVNRFIEAPGQGIDLIRTEATTFTLPANVERLDSLYTPGAVETRTLTGNALDNVIRAGGQNSILRGLDGADSLMGHNGHDTLIGGAGQDTLDGSVIGNDHFRFASMSDSTVNSPDLIRVFWHQPGGWSVDRIALNLIDADVTRAGDQAFTFIGANGFTGIAGQLRVELLAASTFRVSGDVNGDSRADFAIDVGTVPSTTTPSAAWFIL